MLSQVCYFRRLINFNKPIVDSLTHAHSIRRAVSEFVAENSDELTLRTGDIVAITAVVDANWLMGTCRSMVRLFVGV
jgi:hypothetical protein